MFKKTINHILRTAGLLWLSDRVRYAWMLIRMRRRNREFSLSRPEVVLPPAYLVYESYAIDFRNYWEDGLDTARYILGILARHKEMRGVSILDWGCGPARVVRHLPGLLLEKECRILAADYNAETIAWCRKHISGVSFSLNHADPPMELDASGVDALYGISVLTHLTPDQHRAWIAEIARVLRPGGIALLTTHGKSTRSNLMPWERKKFDKGELIARGHAKVGHRTYTSFHPPAFMLELFAGGGLKVVEHVEAGTGASGFGQDVWVVRRT